MGLARRLTAGAPAAAQSGASSEEEGDSDTAAPADATVAPKPAAAENGVANGHVSTGSEGSEGKSADEADEVSEVLVPCHTLGALACPTS